MELVEPSGIEADLVNAIQQDGVVFCMSLSKIAFWQEIERRANSLMPFLRDG
jgi:hypothetical protein